MGFEAFVRRYDSPGMPFYLALPYWGSEDDCGKALFQREVLGKFHLTEVETSYTLGVNAWIRGKQAELVVVGRKGSDKR